MRVLVLAVVAQLSVFGWGCKRRPPEQRVEPPAPILDALPSTAPTFSWRKNAANDFVLVVDGHPNWTITTTYLVVGGTQEVRLREGIWPKGTRVAVGAGERVLATPSDQPFDLTASLPTALGSVPVWRKDPKQPTATPKAATITLKTPMRVRLENGVEIATVLPPTTIEYEDAVRTVTGRSRTGPLTFDDEGAHTGPHSTFYVDTPASLEILGPAKTLSDVDWIAVVEKSIETIGGRQCHYGRATFPLEVETQTVTIFDRRTHDEIVKKAFKPASSCPGIAVDEHAIARVRTEDIKTWIHKTAKPPPHG